MRVILKAEVKGVGGPGDVREVADGFAANYLLPRGLAVEATPSALRGVERQKESAKTKTDREHAEMRELAKRIESVALTFALKSGAQGKVFGSVTNRDIAEALAQRGVRIDRAKIHLGEPLRSLGTHRVEVRLLSDVRADVRVEITAA